jgi:hypothetical protein
VVSEAEKAAWFKETLEQNDREDFQERLTRFREVVEWLDNAPGGLSLGPDQESGLAFSEARFAYVNGLWMSAIVMSLTCIERHLAWRLMVNGTPNTEKIPSKKLIELSVAAGFVSLDQATRMDELRDYRNAYAHFRKESRWREQFRIQEDRQQALWEASGEQDDSIEGINVNMVLHGEAKAAVQLATAYFLAAGWDAFSGLNPN